MYPLDVVKTRVSVLFFDQLYLILTSYFRQLQAGPAVGSEGYTGMVDCFSKIIRHEG